MADIVDIPALRALILEARQMWWEIVSSDEGECRNMGIVRELADGVEALLSELEGLRNREKELERAIRDAGVRAAAMRFGQKGTQLWGVAGEIVDIMHRSLRTGPYSTTTKG
jgi:hypothetical protein